MFRRASSFGGRRPSAARYGLAAVLFVVAGCGSDEPEPYAAVADVQELMYHVVEPAAQEYWAAVGWIVDAEGEHYFRPESDEEWIAVENAAFMVAEAGNLLMMPERRLDDDGWVAMSQQLIDVGRRALEVAEAKDEQAVFDMGAEMYYVCSVCHAAYSPEVLRPSDDRAVPGEAGADGAGDTAEPGSGAPGSGGG